jgi:hypothetical protein
LQWRFRPRVVDGSPVVSRGRYTIDFTINQ